MYNVYVQIDVYVFMFMGVCVYIYIYIYTYTVSIISSCSTCAHPPVLVDGQCLSTWEVLRPISLLTLSLLTLLDSNLPANPLWTWELHPSKLRLCLSQTL